MYPIHHTFAPLADRKHSALACALLFHPWKWKHGTSVTKLEDAIGTQFHGKAFTFGSGREALLAVLKAIKHGNDEEVIVQGYTCMVVPNAIQAAGMKPLFADIDPHTLNLDLADTEARITPKTRAIICQHTFGIPAFTKELRALCDRHSLLLIEDCAHVLPDDQGPQAIGTYGDIVFGSFGRDKAISGVSGGFVVTKDAAISSNIETLQKHARSHGLIHIKLLLMYPLVYAFAKPLYGIGIGKALLAVAGKIRLLVPILTTQEKRGEMRDQLHHLPNACAVLALDQWKRLRSLNDHRRMLTQLYFEEATARNWPMLLGITPDLPLQKFPMFLEHAERIRQELKKKNMHLHDGWTGCVICPANADASCAGYEDGSDPSAEMAGQQIFSLPTHPTMSLRQAHKLVRTLNSILQNKR